MNKKLTLEELEDYAFYESGLSADGCFNKLDQYAIESIKRYGRILIKNNMNNTNNKKYYTPDGTHPEDAIYKVKAFIKELQQVQESYFNKLVDDLNLDKDGEEWLFDYIYNSDDEYDGFDHYLDNSGKKYEDLVIKDTIYNASETFLSTDFGEFNPMTHMSSYEADIETTFPPAYNDKEPINLGLDTITLKHQHISKDNV